MRKKFTTLTLLVILAIVLSGCGKETGEKETNRFYYSQLTKESKKMYKELLKAKEKLINNEPVVLYTYIHSSIFSTEDIDLDFVEDQVYLAFYACSMDNPEINLLINEFKYRVFEKHDGIVYTVQIDPVEETATYADFSSPEEARQAIQEVEEKSEDFIKTLSGLSDEEKAIRIHNWILENAKYDTTVSLPNIRNIYGAIIQKECVCAGFADAFKYLSDMAGLDSIVVVGENHAWNNIRLDGKWYLVDLTWDCGNSPIYNQSKETYVIGNIALTIESSTFTYGTTYSSDYLLKPLEETTATHVPSDDFDVPTPTS